MDDSIPKIIFLIPYRNRIQQKKHYEICMKHILEDYSENTYKTFFIHQCDNRPFNRGAIKNIGFLAVKNLYPNHYKNISLVFNDIDIVPYTKNILHYETHTGAVKHFYGFEYALGGIFSIKGCDFEKTLGFPNFWGWGLEDNTLQKRVLEVNLKIDRSNFFKIYDPNIIILDHGHTRTIAKQESWYYKEGNMDDITHIKDLRYEIKNDMINVLNFNTKYASNSNYYYEQKYPKKIHQDTNFIPSNSKYRLRKLRF